MGSTSESTISLHSKKFAKQLIGALQHEIRNDITNIQSNAYVLSKKASAHGTNTEDYVLKINKKANKILRQINEMSDVYQILSETFELDETSFNGILFVQDIGESMKQLYPTKLVTITTPGEHAIMIHGDKQRLEMVLRRLIEHTNEYSSPASITGIELSLKDHHLEIAICPYKEDKKEHHRKPVADATSQKFNILTIELAIYEKIIQQHKGSIQYVRTVTGDQAFFITLPLRTLPS